MSVVDVLDALIYVKLSALEYDTNIGTPRETNCDRNSA